MQSGVINGHGRLGGKGLEKFQPLRGGFEGAALEQFHHPPPLPPGDQGDALIGDESLYLEILPGGLLLRWGSCPPSLPLLQGGCGCHPVPAGLLGLIHGGVRRSDQLLFAAAVVGIKGDADA